MKTENSKHNLINVSTGDVASVIKGRPIDMHKGDAGRVLLIAGSKGMAGAAVLAARGCLYSGAGLVKLAVPDELFNILQISVPEAMCIERVSLNAEILRDFDAVAIGPGLGVSKENMKLFETLLESYEGSLVIDADGLNCLCKYPLFGEQKLCLSAIRCLFERRGITVLTPHPGEAKRILEALGACETPNSSREEIVTRIAKDTGTISLLKGPATLICDGKANIFVNPTGNPGMATGGSGDVLTGMIAALLAQKYLDAKPVERVIAAAFLHGLAGDIAAENVGEYGMTAADIADAVSAAFKTIAEA